ncbi:hypothetical protein [Rossellomorea sp. NPDC077527]|uniref:hypothetical protein n=1 Tax=Rossellomorea sp. NPDC077527 TaxID=3364510 RepID=UPI0037C85571
MKTYTVDFIDGDQITFLERGNEDHKVIITDEALSKKLSDGVVIDLSFRDDGSVHSYKMLIDETKQTKQESERMLDKILKKTKK